MSTDELDAPLGLERPKKRRRAIPPIVPRLVAGILALCLAGFVAWVVLIDDPFGGEPTAVASADLRGGQQPKTAEPAAPAGPQAKPEPAASPAPAAAEPARGGNTVTIIDGMSGRRQEVTIGQSATAPGAVVPGAAAPASAAAPSRGQMVDQRLIETTRHGSIPKIASDGARPADVYARPAPPASARIEGTRIAIVVTGLGIGANGTSEALAKLPGPVTLAFAPYGTDLDRWVTRARGEGHEVLMQVPMEPFDYPDNDPGPQTLLTALRPEQNVDRLHWFMSRFAGYVGIANYMGARFTASDQAVAPVVREAAKRGLIYFDDGSSTRSLASQIAGSSNAAFAKADIGLDVVPTAAEIDAALVRLEAVARDRGVAVGVATALPISIERIFQWSKASESRGIVLVPISAVANKPKSS